MLYTVDDNRKFPFSTVGIFSISVAAWREKMSNYFKYRTGYVIRNYFWQQQKNFAYKNGFVIHLFCPTVHIFWEGH